MVQYSECSEALSALGVSQSLSESLRASQSQSVFPDDCMGKVCKIRITNKYPEFLDRVYPNASSRPDYICIDKGCVLLRHAVTSGRWNVWKDTTHFIVDSYHYINHRTTDYVCRKWCNPAPLNGSAPNLVVVENDKFGQPHFKQAFNAQVGFLSTVLIITHFSI